MRTEIFSQIFFIFILSLYSIDTAPPKNESTEKEASSSGSAGAYTIRDYAMDIKKHLAKVEIEKLIQEAKEWAQDLGLVVIQSKFTKVDQGFNVISDEEVGPFTLFPSPFPRKFFDQAYNIQTAFNLLYFRVIGDYQFLREVFQDTITHNQMLAKAFEILDQVHAEGIKQPFTLLFQRADYMVCKKNSDENEETKLYQLKQVEINGASTTGFAFSDLTTKLHKNVLSNLGLNMANHVESDTISLTVDAIYHAWQKFADTKAIVLIIVAKNRPNYYESWIIKKKLHDKYAINSVVLSLFQCAKMLTLNIKDFSLRLNKQIVVAVVFNQQTMLNEDTYQMKARLIIERSTAIKAPSLIAVLAYSKKIQQALAQPGMVERFFPNPEEAPLIKAIRDTEAKIWTIERDNDKFAEMMKKIENKPNNFVLKRIESTTFQDSDTKKIYFGEEIIENLAIMDEDERSAFILMEKLQPMSVKNHIVWSESKSKEESSGGDFFEEVTPELGIFGTLFGNIANGEVERNAQLGHWLKTKMANDNEGGIATGHSAYDSAFLVD